MGSGGFSDSHRRSLRQLIVGYNPQKIDRVYWGFRLLVETEGGIRIYVK